MPLQTSGPISLDDIHVEAGGTTGTTASINDADIRALIGKADGAEMSFNEWYGAGTQTYTLSNFQNSGSDYFVNGNSSTSASSFYGDYPSGNSGATARLLFAYVSGSSYTGDLQIDDVYYDATDASTGGTALDFNDSAPSDAERGSVLYTRTSSYAFPVSDLQTEYAANTFSTVPSGVTNGNWTADANGTGSSGTGLTVVGDGFYILFETSGNGTGYPYKMRFLRSSEFTVGSSGGVRFKCGHYGSTIGKLQVFLVTED